MPATNKSLQLFLFSKRTIVGCQQEYAVIGDRKSTRLNSSPRLHLVCRLLLEKKKHKPTSYPTPPLQTTARPTHISHTPQLSRSTILPVSSCSVHIIRSYEPSLFALGCLHTS